MFALEFATARPPGAAAYYCLVVRDPYTVGAALSCEVCLQSTDMPPQLASLTVLHDTQRHSKDGTQQQQSNGHVVSHVKDAQACSATAVTVTQGYYEDEDKHEDDMFADDTLVLRVTALTRASAPPQQQQHSRDTDGTPSRRSGRASSEPVCDTTTSSNGHANETASAAVMAATTPSLSGCLRVCGRVLAAGEHVYARDGDVIDCGAHVSFVLRYRPLCVSIERGAFTLDYARDLTYMFHRLGATMCAMPTPSAAAAAAAADKHAHNRNDDKDADEQQQQQQQHRHEDDEHSCGTAAASSRCLPIARLHCAEELTDSVACVRALACDVTIVQPTYVFEWFAALAQSAACALSALPPPHAFAVPVRRVSAYATSSLYVRPESATCPYSLYAIPPTALHNTRTRARLFAQRHIVLLAPSTQTRYAAALRWCGARVYDASAAATALHAVRTTALSMTCSSHSNTNNNEQHDSNNNNTNTTTVAARSCTLYVIVDAEMEAYMRRRTAITSSSSAAIMATSASPLSSSSSSVHAQRVALRQLQQQQQQQQREVVHVHSVHVPVTVHVMGEHTLFTSLLTNAFRCEPIPQHHDEEEDKDVDEALTGAVPPLRDDDVGGVAAAAAATATARTSQSPTHTQTASLHEPSYIDVSQASSDAAAGRDMASVHGHAQQEQQQQQRVSLSWGNAARDSEVLVAATATAPVAVPALDTALLTHVQRQQQQQQPRGTATPRGSSTVRRSLQCLPYRILHDANNVSDPRYKNNNNSRDNDNNVNQGSHRRRCSMRYCDGSDSLLPRTPNRTPSRSQLRCRSRVAAAAAAAAEAAAAAAAAAVRGGYNVAAACTPLPPSSSSMLREQQQQQQQRQRSRSSSHHAHRRRRLSHHRQHHDDHAGGTYNTANDVGSNGNSTASAAAAVGGVMSAARCAMEYDVLRTRIYSFLLKAEPPLDVAVASCRRNHYVHVDDVDRALEVRAASREFLSRLDALYAQPAATPYAPALRQFAYDCAVMDDKAQWLVWRWSQRMHAQRRSSGSGSGGGGTPAAWTARRAYSVPVRRSTPPTSQQATPRAPPRHRRSTRHMGDDGDGDGVRCRASDSAAVLCTSGPLAGEPRSYTPRSAATVHGATYRSSSRPSAPPVTVVRRASRSSHAATAAVMATPMAATTVTTPPPPQTTTTTQQQVSQRYAMHEYEMQASLALHPHNYYPSRHLVRDNGEQPSRRRRVSASTCSPSPAPRRTAAHAHTAAAATTTDATVMQRGMRNNNNNNNNNNTTGGDGDVATPQQAMASASVARGSTVWRPTRNTPSDAADSGTPNMVTTTAHGNAAPVKVNTTAAAATTTVRSYGTSRPSPRPRRSASSAVVAHGNVAWRRS